jgi:hypothetical protein
VIACWCRDGVYDVKDGYNIKGAHTFVLDNGSSSGQVSLSNGTGIEDQVFTCR